MTDRRRIRRFAALAGGVLALALGPLAAPAAEPGAAAAPGTALLFDRGQLAGLAPGDGLVYGHSRRVPAGAEVAPIEGGEVRVALASGGAGAEARVSLTEAGRTRRLDPFPAGSGNPVFVVFLESALRAMAGATGGSPFYLRNRIREAFRQGAAPEPVAARFGGAELAAERVVFRPFAADGHVAELGDFRGIEIEFVLSAAVPGRFLSLVAATPPGGDAAFREEIRLIGEVQP